MNAGRISELVGKSFSIVVTSDQPVFAERAMYFGVNRFWDGGHESPGVTQPSTLWFHPEGATGSFFDTYILVGNPNAVPATVTFTFLLEAGAPVVKTKTIPPNSRLTVNVEAENPRLLAAAVSTVVSRTFRSSLSGQCTGQAGSRPGTKRTTASASRPPR